MRSLRAAAFLLACTVVLTMPAFADVTMTMTVVTSGGPARVETTAVTYVQGMKMRTDIKVSGQDMSFFVDVATKQQLMVNNATREVTDSGAMMASLPVTIGDMTVSVTPNGQTKDVLGRSCAGYTVTYSVPMTMLGETLAISSSGVVWIAKDAPGAAEYLAFLKAAAAAGLMSGVISQGPQAKALAQVQAALTDKGVPLEQEMQIKITGAGQMAQMMAQSGAGNIAMTMRVSDISINPIPAGTVDVPAAALKK